MKIDSFWMRIRVLVQKLKLPLYKLGEPTLDDGFGGSRNSNTEEANRLKDEIAAEINSKR